MSYSYNRNAFKAGSNEALPILLRTYCSLVVLELGLKDFLGKAESPANAGHDLPDLLNQVKMQNRGAAASINAIQTQLRRELSSVRCQGKRGSAQSVPAESYPHIRYVRHSTDWPTDYTSDGQLHSVFGTISKLFSSLNHHKIAV